MTLTITAAAGRRASRRHKGGGGSASSFGASTATVAPVARVADGHRQPHRADLRGPDHRRHGQGDGLPPDQGRRGRLRADDLRPGVHQHRLLPQLDHLHRRRGRLLEYRGIPIEQLCESSSYLEVAYLLVHGELPSKQRSTTGSTRSPTTPTSTRTSRSRWRRSATTPIRWRCCSRPSARCRPTTRRRRTSTTRPSATCRSSG